MDDITRKVAVIHVSGKQSTRSFIVPISKIHHPDHNGQVGQLTHIGKSRKLFSKTGADTGDIPKTFSRRFPNFAISGHEGGDFAENISSSIA